MAASTKKALFSATISLLGPVAQSVEQRIENPCVGGSIPPQATKFTPRLGPVLVWRFLCATIAARRQKRNK